MNLAYVLPDPELSGGIKVVFQHAQLLRQLGHAVTIFGRGPKPLWIHFDGRYVNYEKSPPQIESQDLVIATYWSTIPIAKQFNFGPVAHYCQGYEGDLPHLSSMRSQIESVYQQNMPMLVVTPYLGKFLHQRFGCEFRVAPPTLDLLFRPAFRVKPRPNSWIMVSGVFQSEVKGIRTALEAIIQLRKAGQRCRVMRVSVLPLSAEEREILTPDLYLCSVEPKVVARHLRNCDLLLFSSLPTEGFGLPALEAMGSKVPVVASRIPATEYMGGEKLILIAPTDAAAFASAAHALLKNSQLWRQARRQVYEAAMKFHPRNLASQLEERIKWALQMA